MKPLLLSLLISSLSFSAFAESQKQNTIRISPPRIPIQLVTPMNETAIQIQKVSTKVEILGSLAETTIELTFFNPNNRQLEGTLEFPLIEGQNITALALDINGEMRDAVPVPKAKGREVFEAIERRKVDPALLEQTAGNNFKLRVYPIPAKGTRTVRIQYQEVLANSTSGRQYSLPVNFGHSVSSYQLEVIAKGSQNQPISSQLNFKQNKSQHYSASLETKNINNLKTIDVVIPNENTPRLYTQSFKNQDYFYAEIPLSSESQVRELPNKIGILWDASLSARNKDIKSELALLDDYFKQVKNATVELTVLRHQAENPVQFKIKNGDWSSLKQYIEKISYDGASNLSNWKNNTQIDEYLLFSDGLENFGLKQKIQLQANQRLYTIYSNKLEIDSLRLRQFAESNHGQFITWSDATSFKHAQNQLFHDSDHLIRVDGKGVSDLQIPSYFAEDGLVKVFGQYSKSVGDQANLEIQVQQGKQVKNISLPFKNTTESKQIAPLWANYKVQELSQNATENQKQIQKIGQTFNIVTPNTSLIVLENLSDYLQYGIEFPESLRAEYLKTTTGPSKFLAHQQASQHASNRRDAINTYKEHQEWWNKKWPKDKPKEEKVPKKYAQAVPIAADAASAEYVMESAAVAHAPSPLANQSLARRTQSSNAATGSSNISIEIQPWKENAPYIDRLEKANKQQAFQIYLDERAENINNPSFYLTVADIFLQKGMNNEAKQVVSNLAELNLENRYILRLLGQQLMVLKQYEDAIQVYKKVLNIAEEEPQSWRDLALAYAENKQYDDAITTMNEVVNRKWDSRFGGIQLIAIDELNNMIAKAPNSAAINKIDKELIQNLPVGIRVVLTWDSDNSDMDLWVIDPNGEKTFYGNKNSYQGGKISNDFTGGYGPEVFWLKEPKSGEYTIKAHYFGDRQQIVTGPTTAFVRLIRNWGKPNQSEEILRIKMTKDRLNSGDDGGIMIGKFTVK